MAIMDIMAEKIERDIGDRWGRTPHLTADDSQPDGPYVLYVPTGNGKWAAKAVDKVATAIKVVDDLVNKFRVSLGGS